MPAYLSTVTGTSGWVSPPIMVARQRDTPDYGEHSIEDWRAAGLLKAPVIKTLIVTT